MHPIGLRKIHRESDHRKLRPTFQKGLRARESRRGAAIADEQFDALDSSSESCECGMCTDWLTQPWHWEEWKRMRGLLSETEAA